MIAYIDSSVILRVVLGQPGQLPEWGSVLTGISSALTEVECARTIDRLRLLGKLTPEQAVDCGDAISRVLDALEVVGLESKVLRRAMHPRSVALGSLDALHLASAEAWRDAQGHDAAFATHDRQLALAARASGFKAIGV